MCNAAFVRLPPSENLELRLELRLSLPKFQKQKWENTFLSTIIIRKKYVEFRLEFYLNYSSSYCLYIENNVIHNSLSAK